jgi:hypothetical protein
MTNKTTEQVSTRNMNLNPTGKGGFKEHPENRNPGGWSKENSLSYQYKYLLSLTDAEFGKWMQKHKPKKRTVAQTLAYDAVISARKDFQYLKEITDRTEGRAAMAPEDRTAGGIQLPTPDTVEEKDLLVDLLNAHHDYVTSKSNTTE